MIKEFLAQDTPFPPTDTSDNLIFTIPLFENLGGKIN